MRLRMILCLLIAVTVTACGSSNPPTETAPSPRAVTLSPALTRMVFDMGLGDHLVGVDTYSLRYLPAGVDRPAVGDALSVRPEPLLAVHPELVLAQIAPEKFQAVLRIDPDLRIESFTIESLEDIPAAARRIGVLLGDAPAGEAAAGAFETAFADIRASVADRPKVSCAFVTGYRNFMAAGGGTFLGGMIAAAGGENTFADLDNWKQPSLETLMVRRPAVIICLARDDADGAEARRYWEQLGAAGENPYRKRVVILTDSSWTVPGLHLADKAKELVDILHTEATP